MTPLHRAVVEGDDAAVFELASHRDWLTASDKLGFTPLELAQFLGKYDYLKPLGGTLPATFWVQKKGQSELTPLSLTEFESFFQVVFRPFLFFPSYRFFKEVINNCPYILRSQWLAEDNYAWAAAYQKHLKSGETIPIEVKWIDEVMGYGAFAGIDVRPGTFVGEYAGLVRRLYRLRPDHNAYCLRYPSRLWSLKYFVIDSLQQGNLTRFINHSDSPNIQPLCLVDRNLLRQVFVASKSIVKGEQLFFDYGQDYWIKRQKT